jgi:hypothetical protein
MEGSNSTGVAMTGWTVAYALPNLRLGQGERHQLPHDEPVIALVPFGDERVQSLIARDVEARELLTNFVDKRRKPIKPAVLLVTEDASRMFGFEGAVAFRNAVALAVVAKARAIEHATLAAHAPEGLGIGNPFGPLSSDYFDFDPTFVHSGRRFMHSPALSALDTLPYSPFIGVSTTYIMPLEHQSLDADRVLLDALERAWLERYLGPDSDPALGRVLFRSLEMAYFASATHFKNQGSQYDRGVGISLWISAFEILAHHGRDRADLHAVLNLLGAYAWTDDLLQNHRHTVQVGKKNLSLTMVQAIYAKMHHARNAFLHGNEVGEETLSLPPFLQGPALTSVAPIVYRTALFQLLHDSGLADDSFESRAAVQGAAARAEGSAWTDSQEAYEGYLKRLLGQHKTRGAAGR